jgi:dTDP-4-amino-4,6-dideoxygalactose transaminase
MINVTKTFFPPLEEYSTQLKRIWKNQWLTNRGALVQELEKKLKEYLGVNNLTLTTNGTLPIQIAIKALGLSGEVITTPFSYVATTSAIVWENCTPVFVDIDPEYLTIDENKIEAAITDKTTAILATHVFGNPCNVEVIAQIAKKHNLKVIYDAAHCFGVEYNGQSIFNYGDISTCSFHATKIFHTGEGGCWITNNEELQQKMYYMHNFGHNGPEAFHGVGINAKMSELQAAMGLAVLPYFDDIRGSRGDAISYYNNNLNFEILGKMKLRDGTVWNNCYYPILFQSEDILLAVMLALNKAEVNPRRYFYPSLNNLNYVDNVDMPVSDSVASRVLCLPLFKGISEDELFIVCNTINENLEHLKVNSEA